uniref:Uncharacterized protein n=1 Tax=Aegilops tauschii subsp. strangulata TaxID=200361 RepID=A0A453PF65_AEGTS
STSAQRRGSLSALHFAKRSWVRTSLSALHFAGVRLGSYNPSPDPTLCGSFYALGLSFSILIV